VADVRHDFVRTINQDLLRMDVDAARAVLTAQVEEGRRLLAGEGVDLDRVTVQHAADMQYAGQTHVLTVPIPRTDLDRDDLLLGFERAYWERFEVELREMRCLVMSLRTAVIGHRRPVAIHALAAARRDGRAAPPSRTRRVWFGGRWHDTPVFRRETLGPGIALEGPAIVEQLDATTVVEPGDRVAVDALGNLVISVGTVA
jgi:N-methylhydantoinase A